MSRPSSRMSSISHARPNGTSSAAGSLSSASGAPYSGAVPFTPGAAAKSSRNTKLGLSVFEMDRLGETIASAQRGTLGTQEEQRRHERRNGSEGGEEDKRREWKELQRRRETMPVGGTGKEAVADRKGKGRASLFQPQASFIAEASFIDAPLNSRVSASPRKTASSRPAKPLIPRSADEYKSLTSTRLRQIIMNSEAEVDDEADLKLYDEHVPDDGEGKGKQREDLGDADIQIQEALLIEDLLSVLMGIESQYITFAPTYDPQDTLARLRGACFSVDEHIDPSLRDLVDRILPLARYYTAIDAFVEAYSHLEFGLTSHALCSAIREQLREYLVLIAQLEDHFASSPTFSLQKFHFYCQPMLHKLFLIHSLITDLTTSPYDGIDEGNSTEEDEKGADELASDDDDDDDRFGGGAALRAAMKGMSTNENGKSSGGGLKSWNAGGPVKGGEVLSIIDERLQRTSGDPVAAKLYGHLLLKASQPYAETLLGWISTGQLTDPYDEFLIKEAKNLHRTALDQDYVDEYWERKYTLKDSAAGSASVSGTRGGAGDGMGDEDGALAQGGLSELGASRDGSWGAEDSVRKRAQKRESGLGGGAIVPAFLEQYKVKILLAGDSDTSKDKADADVDMMSDTFQARIDSAYLSANTALLHLLISEQALFPRLRSLKHHFFLDLGDGFTHFLDLASHELSKKAKHVSLSKLQSLLDVAIRNPSSASSGDPYKEDVKVAMSSSTLTDWLMRVVNVSSAIGAPTAAGAEDGVDLPPASASAAASAQEKDKKKETVLLGIDALSLDYTVKFPLSLVLSRKAILRYQLLFRHLLSLRSLEQLLGTAWLEHTKSPIWRKNSLHPGLEAWKARVYTLRSRMLAFVQQLFSYAVMEVLEGNWNRMMLSLESEVRTVDQLLRFHTDFLDTCLKECMLTNPKLLKLQQKLMTTITLFCSYSSRLTKNCSSITLSTREALERGEPYSSISIALHDDFLSKFEINFYRHQKTHMDTVSYHALSDTAALLALTVRLANTMPEGEGLAR